MRILQPVLFCIAFLAFSSVSGQEHPDWSIGQKIPSGYLKKDLNKLHHGLYKNHPGLFDYIDATVWDDLTDSIFLKADTAMTILEFYRAFVPMVSQIGCGHTVVEPPIKLQEFLRQHGQLFPFSVRFFDRKMFIYRNGSDNNDVTEGFEIVAINGKTAAELVEELFLYIPSNANTEGRKFGVLEEFFELYYALIIGQPIRFTIEGRTLEGINHTFQIEPLSADKIDERIEERYKIKLGVPFPYAVEFSEVLNTAVVTIHTFDQQLFEYAGVNFELELDSLCQRMADKNINNLIVDLRNNKGGSRMMATTLLSRFIEQPVLNNDIVYVASHHPILNHGDPGLKKHMRGAKVHTGYRKYQIKNKYLQMKVDPAELRFKGQIYILVNKNTFSAASHIASFLRNYSDATIVGQTSSGFEFYSNAGFFYNCWMGHTGFLVKVPYFQSWYFDEVAARKQLLSPDYFVKESIESLLGDEDLVMKRTISLIRESGIK